MEDKLLAALAGQGGYALLLGALGLWLAKAAWPQVVARHDAALAVMERGFTLLGERIAGLERREAQRIRLGWLRELRAQGLSPEDALLKTEEILGNQ
jgi:hypothetical protein